MMTVTLDKKSIDLCKQFCWLWKGFLLLYYQEHQFSIYQRNNLSAMEQASF